MEVRKDLEDVEGLIFRLLNYGNEFSKYISDWVHYKAKEDFDNVHCLPQNQQGIVRAVYCDGRDMAQYMSDSLAAINSDFTEYPTLTSIVNGFNDIWVYGNYDGEVPNKALAVCHEHGKSIWAVNQMCSLFRTQEKILNSVRDTLRMLKQTAHYKLENGEKIVPDKTSIIVTGNKESNISIQSSNVAQSLSIEYSEPLVFSEMLEAISAADLDKEVEEQLVKDTQLLAENHKSGTFTEGYKDFMQNISAHITVFTPILSGLVALL